MLFFCSDARDCMYERIRYPDERMVVERYLPGTPSSLREVIEVSHWT